MQKTATAVSWLALAFVAYATLSPLENRPVVAGLQLEHFAAFALMGMAFAMGYPDRLRLAIIVVIGSAFVLETLQLLTPDRHGRVVDALVKAAGGICGIGTGHVANLFLGEKISRIKQALRRRPG